MKRVETPDAPHGAVVAWGFRGSPGESGQQERVSLEAKKDIEPSLSPVVEAVRSFLSKQKGNEVYVTYKKLRYYGFLEHKVFDIAVILKNYPILTDNWGRKWMLKEIARRGRKHCKTKIMIYVLYGAGSPSLSEEAV